MNKWALRALNIAWIGLIFWFMHYILEAPTEVIALVVAVMAYLEALDKV